MRVAKRLKTFSAAVMIFDVIRVSLSVNRDLFEEEVVRTVTYGWRNEEVKRRVCRSENMSDTVDRKVLMGFGHVDRIKRKRFTIRIYDSKVECRKDRGRFARNDWTE